MKASITSDFIIFIAGTIILLVILSTAFGKGIVTTFVESFLATEPSILSEDIATTVSIASYAPGDFVSVIEPKSERIVEITLESGIYYVSVSERNLV